MTIAILSDGRMGHLNQSIAFAKHLKATYEIIPVSFTCKAFKLLSYGLDWCKIYTLFLFKCKAPMPKHCDMIVSAGSGTYYANKTLSKKYGLKSIAMMLPKSYRLDFDLIFAQAHDTPRIQNNIIPLLANFSYVEPKGFFNPQKKSIGVIIGGNNAHFTMDKKHIKTQLDFIFAHFADYEIAVTTSPRTPKEIETLLQDYLFSYRVIFSHSKINPIADFLHHCEVVFITMDSTSMISEAISYGQANVEILPLGKIKNNKFFKMAQNLENEGFGHIFDGNLGHQNKKIDFHTYAQKALV